MKKKVIVVGGPTASGKTKLSIEIAKHFNLEIINGDSVQAIKGLDIGSAKITEKEKNNIKHHLIDILEVNQKYNVYDFQKDARKIIDESNEEKIICGGTGLYIKACLCNYEFEERQRSFDFEKFYENLSNEELFEILKEKDIEACKVLHPNNRRRVLRAIEIIEESNKLKSEKNKKDQYLYSPLILFLLPKREQLYQKINQRVDLMFEQGLEKEVRDLYNKNILIEAIGYKEFYPYFENKISLYDVKELIKKNTRHFAKRQITFFKNQLLIKVIEVDYLNFDKTINTALDYVKEFLK